MLQRILILICKEILAVWRDKKSRTVLIVPPIIQLFIFTFAATLDVKNVPIGILNLDNGEQSIELAQRFHGSPTFNHIVSLNSVEEIAPFIDTQQGAMVVFFDEQFSRNLNAKKNTNIQLILDGRKSNTAQIIAGYTAVLVDQFNRDFAQRKGLKQPQAKLFPYDWFNPNLLYYWYNVPSLSGVLTMLVGLIVTALSVARERELGTFDQLLVSPAKPIEILLGKTLPAIMIGTLEGSFIVLVGIFIFRIPFTGSFLLLFFSMIVFVSSLVGVGLFISALSQTQQQAILGSFVFMSPAVLLSGFATPIENMPNWLQSFTYINPLRYYLVIAKGSFLKAMPMDVVLGHVWPMAVIALCTLTAAGMFFRRRLE